MMQGITSRSKNIRLAQIKELDTNSLRNEYRKIGILDKWHEKKLEDFDNDDKALATVNKYLKHYENMLEEGVGLFLWGANGTGKTYLLTTTFKKLFKLGYSVKIISLSTLITKYASGWYDSKEKKEFFDLLKRVDFLAIEEIGKEFKSIKGNENDLSTTVLDTVIRYRVQMKKPVWCTSNLAPSKLKSRYTEDVASMLKEACYIQIVSGKDKRTEVGDKLNDFFEDDDATRYSL